MTQENTGKMKQCFVQALGISDDVVTGSLAYQSIPEWDSTGHMALVAEVEAQFDVMLDTDDIIDMSSVEVACQILRKHGVAI
jgi:acyl carrier protein